MVNQSTVLRNPIAGYVLPVVASVSVLHVLVSEESRLRVFALPKLRVKLQLLLVL